MRHSLAPCQYWGWSGSGVCQAASPALPLVVIWGVGVQRVAPSPGPRNLRDLSLSQRLTQSRAAPLLFQDSIPQCHSLLLSSVLGLRGTAPHHCTGALGSAGAMGRAPPAELPPRSLQHRAPTTALGSATPSSPLASHPSSDEVGACQGCEWIVSLCEPNPRTLYIPKGGQQCTYSLCPWAQRALLGAAPSQHLSSPRGPAG